MLADSCFVNGFPHEVGSNWTDLSRLREKAMKSRDSASVGGKGEVVMGIEPGQSFDVETTTTVEISDAYETQLPSIMDPSTNTFDHLYWNPTMNNTDLGSF